MTEADFLELDAARTSEIDYPCDRIDRSLDDIARRLTAIDTSLDLHDLGYRGLLLRFCSTRWLVHHDH
jgi:hypothetical protein